MQGVETYKQVHTPTLKVEGGWRVSVAFAFAHICMCMLSMPNIIISVCSA